MDERTIEKARELFEAIERKGKSYDLQRHGKYYDSDETKRKWESFLAAYQLGYEEGLSRKSSGL
jgi:hypothetical protein